MKLGERRRRHPKYAQVCTGRGGWLKNWSYDTYVLNGWPQTNFVEYFLSTGSAKYTRVSPPGRKMSLFPSMIITIILFFAIIRT